MTTAQARAALELVRTAMPGPVEPVADVGATWPRPPSWAARCAPAARTLRCCSTRLLMRTSPSRSTDTSPRPHPRCSSIDTPSTKVTVLGQLRRRCVENARTDNRDTGVLFIEPCEAATCAGSAGHYLRVVLEDECAVAVSELGRRGLTGSCGAGRQLRTPRRHPPQHRASRPRGKAQGRPPRRSTGTSRQGRSRGAHGGSAPAGTACLPACCGRGRRRGHDPGPASRNLRRRQGSASRPQTDFPNDLAGQPTSHHPAAASLGSDAAARAVHADQAAPRRHSPRRAYD